jgi:hypothetical protein
MSEMPLLTPLYKLKKMKDRRIKQVFSRGRYKWEGKGHKKRVNEGEYGGGIHFHV